MDPNTLAALPPQLRQDHEHVKWFEERLQRAMQDFEQSLAADEQILVTVVLPGGKNIIATFFGYHGPDMLIVHGIDDQNRKCRVLAVHRTVHIVLTAISRTKEPVRTIGFQSSQTNTEQGRASEGLP